MIDLNLIMDGDAAWPDLPSKDVKEPIKAEASMLTHGMKSGRTSVGFRFDMPDGSVVLYQTSLRILEIAVKTFRAREMFLGIADDEGEGFLG